MGRYTELFGYLKTTPQDWKSGKVTINTFTHITINEKIKKLRRTLKLYNNEQKF